MKAKTVKETSVTGYADGASIGVTAPATVKVKMTADEATKIVGRLKELGAVQTDPDDDGDVLTDLYHHLMAVLR